VRQGRTDAWIAHQLDVSTSELRAFRKRHELEADDGTGGDEIDLRDEIEAEVEAAMEAEAEAKAKAEAEEAARKEAEAAERAKRAAERAERGESDDDETSAAGSGDSQGSGEGDSEGNRPRRRRGRRGGRRRGGRSRRPGAGMQASFDHGETDGYGLWLDPAVKDDPIYAEHWAGERKLEVTIEPERIVIKRYVEPTAASGDAGNNGSGGNGNGNGSSGSAPADDSGN